jgi:putative membrane protein
MRFIRLLLFLVLILLGAAFTVMNAGTLHLDYYFGTLDLPLSLVLIATLGIGALLGVLASLGTLFRMKRENAHLRRQVRLTSEEVRNLRSIPIKER